MTTCPYCASPNAYNSGFHVECVNHECKFFSAKWAGENVSIPNPCAEIQVGPPKPPLFFPGGEMIPDGYERKLTFKCTKPTSAFGRPRQLTANSSGIHPPAMSVFLRRRPVEGFPTGPVTTVSSADAVNHGDLSGLADVEHSQYAPSPLTRTLAVLDLLEQMLKLHRLGR